jgi:hypothetical protein
MAPAVPATPRGLADHLAGGIDMAKVHEGIATRHARGCASRDGGGCTGNASALIGRAHRAAAAAGWTPAEVRDLTARLTAGTYDELLRVLLVEFDVNAGEP